MASNFDIFQGDGIPGVSTPIKMASKDAQYLGMLKDETGNPLEPLFNITKEGHELNGSTRGAATLLQNKFDTTMEPVQDMVKRLVAQGASQEQLESAINEYGSVHNALRPPINGGMWNPPAGAGAVVSTGVDATRSAFADSDFINRLNNAAQNITRGLTNLPGKIGTFGMGTVLPPGLDELASQANKIRYGQDKTGA